MKIGIDIGSHTVKAAELLYERTPVPIRDKQTRACSTPTRFYHVNGRFLVGTPASIMVENSIIEGELPVSVENIGQEQLVLTDDRKNEWRTESIFALLLKKISLDMTSPNSGAIFCLSPDVSEKQKKGYELISGIADIPYLTTTIAPICAAVYHQVVSESPTLVVDWGHSGLRLTLLKYSSEGYQILATKKTNAAGGASWTEKLRDYIVGNWRQYLGLNLPSASILESVAEHIKIQLSEQLVAKQTVVFDSELLHVIVTRDEFDRLVTEDLAQFEQLLSECLNTAQVFKDAICDVVVTGGNTLVPAVLEQIRKSLPRVKNWYDKEPVLAQALGTALFLPQTKTVEHGDYPSDNALSIGILNEKTHKIDVAIRDTHTPGVAVRSYATTSIQPNLSLSIIRSKRNQREQPKPENTEIGRLDFSPRLPGSKLNLTIEFKYMKNGELLVDVYDMKSSLYQSEKIVALSAEEYYLFSQMEQIRTAIVNGEI